MTSDVPETVLPTLRAVDGERQTRRHAGRPRLQEQQAVTSHRDGKSPSLPKHSCDRSPEHTREGDGLRRSLGDEVGADTGRAHLVAASPAPPSGCQVHCQPPSAWTRRPPMASGRALVAVPGSRWRSRRRSCPRPDKAAWVPNRSQPAWAVTLSLHLCLRTFRAQGRCVPFSSCSLGKPGPWIVADGAGPARVTPRQRWAQRLSRRHHHAQLWVWHAASGLTEASSPCPPQEGRGPLCSGPRWPVALPGLGPRLGLEPARASLLGRPRSCTALPTTATRREEREVHVLRTSLSTPACGGGIQ